MTLRRRGVALVGAVLACASARAQVPPGLPSPDDSDARDSDAAADRQAGRKLQAVLRAHGSEIYGCYSAALVEHPSLAGEVLIRMTVLPEGAVERADVLKDDAGSQRLGECLTESIRTWKVSELAGEARTQFVFPLAFHPEAAAPTPPPAPIKPRRYVVPLSDGKPGPLGTGGRVEARVLVDETTVGATQASLTWLGLSPTARLALHTHPRSTELLYVLRGLARARDTAGGMLIANAGDVIVLPAGVPHNIEAAPLASLAMLQLFVPGGPERAYRDPRDRADTVPASKTRKVPARPGHVIKVVNGSDARWWPLPGGKIEVAMLLDGLTGADAVASASLQRLEASAGAEVKEHVHEDADEIVYVQSGRGEISVGGLVLPIGPGDAIHIPMRTPHGYKVTEKLVALQLYAPAGPEQRFKLAPGSIVEGPKHDAPAPLPPSPVEKR